MEEMIGRVEGGEDLERLEAALARRRGQLKADSSSADGVGSPRLSEVVEYRPHEDGLLQAEIRRYARKDGVAGAAHGPYWYYKYHEGGRSKTLYLGKTDDPAAALEARRKGAAL